MNIHIIKTDEADEAYNIAERLPGYFNEQGLREIKAAVTKDTLFGAFDEDKMVGFVIYKELNPEAVELAWMGVLTEYQSQGVGTQMVEESLNEIKGQYKLCEVKTLAETKPDPGYAKTRAFYKKLGFIPLEIIDPYPGWEGDNPCQILVKPL